MAVHDFAFALALSGHLLDSELLTEVLRTVLSHAGYGGDTLERLVRQVDVKAAGSPPLPCRVRFEAHAGELQIVVSQAGREWRTTCPVLIHE